MIYHLTTQTEWDDAQNLGNYSFCSLKTEGFIHCSTDQQFLEVANRLFLSKKAVLLLEIDESLIECDIRYENLEGGEEKFPHIYGPIELAAITRVFSMPRNEKGLFSSPLA